MHFNEVWGNNFGLVVKVQSMIELRWLVGAVHGSCSHANPQSRISIASPPPPPPPPSHSPHSHPFKINTQQ